LSLSSSCTTSFLPLFPSFCVIDALLAQKDNNDFMKELMISTMSTFSQQNNLTLAEIKNLISAGGGKGGEVELYSSMNQVNYLSTKANDLKEKCQNLIVISPQGVGLHNYSSLSGENGRNGRKGDTQLPAKSGSDGNNLSHTGGDGEDGEDGTDGEAGEVRDIEFLPFFLFLPSFPSLYF
jgi:hypothetical protein